MARSPLVGKFGCVVLSRKPDVALDVGANVYPLQ
jgi:hypothetical protein